ncbi:MAG TPA: 4'-phosphopantetheinyl transferase superfamily protein [Anaerolineaceae bacterium]|nr:4'-phosphopantetheinyl transferase superfamily protein [Anaerolineaceae bacterium]
MTGTLADIQNIEWNAPNRGDLGPGEIHVWKVMLDRWLNRTDQLIEILSDEEIKQVKRFRFNLVGIRYATTHACLRLVLGRYLSQPAGEIKFRTGPGGKPYLEQDGSNPQKSLSFNISHSEDVLLISIAAQAETGIDVEKIKPEFQHEQVSKLFFAPFEQAWIADFPPEIQETAFYRLWTCKEAVLKGEGSGMRIDLETVKIEFEDETSAAYCVLPVAEGEGQLWKIQLFVPAPQYTAALAYRFNASAAAKKSVKFFEWTG